MKFIIIRCAIFMTLLAGFNNLCMESNEENNKEHSPLDNELKQMRQEHAKQYQREKEKKQKKAEHLHAKNKKLNKQQEQPEAKPEKNSDGKQEELESQIPSEPLLTQEGQTELFAQAKQAIALARAKATLTVVAQETDLAHKDREQAATPTPKDILNIFKEEADRRIQKLNATGIDEIIWPEQIISLMDNIKTLITYEDFELLITNDGHYKKLPSTIWYALLRNPYSNSSHVYQYNIRSRPEVFNYEGLQRNSLYRNCISIQSLFCPFALSRANMLRNHAHRFCSNNKFSQEYYGSYNKAVRAETKNLMAWRAALRPLGLCDNKNIYDQVAKLRLDHIELNDKDIGYMSITRNVYLIRIILFFATYTGDMDLDTLKQFVGEKSSDITGNERVPDGTTALMFAVGGGYAGIVKELLHRGANPFLMNNHGDDAFSIVEIQLKRATLHNNSELIKIYTRIQQLLEASARKYALHIAQLIRALQSERILPNGTQVPALPWELALRIALVNLSTNGQRIILRLFNQFPADRLFPLVAAEPLQQEADRLFPLVAAEPVQQEMAGVPQMPGFSHYLPAWIVALLSYSVLSFANKS